MKKYKNLVGTVVFLFIGIILFVMISYGLRPLDSTFRRTRVVGFYGEEDNTLDVVSIGSSAIYRYLNNPYLWQEFNITSYNFATPQQPITIMENIIDEIRKTQNPQVILIETRPFNIEEGFKYKEHQLKQVTDNLKYSVNRIEMINKHIEGWDNRLAAYLDIVSYHDTWENFNADSIEYMDNDEKHPLKGWAINSIVKSQHTPNNGNITDTLPISTEAETILRNVLEKCKEEEIPVLFVATPFDISVNEQKRNNYIGQIIKEYDGKFLDCNLYNEEIGLNYETDFYNKRHTNSIGAEKVTKFIGEYMIENCGVVSDHSKETIKEWDEAVEKYLIRTKNARELIPLGISVERKSSTDEDKTKEEAEEDEFYDEDTSDESSDESMDGNFEENPDDGVERIE